MLSANLQATGAPDVELLTALASDTPAASNPQQRLVELGSIPNVLSAL
jgi:hypothetical protein